MGRGLSELQKRILKLAYTNATTPKDCTERLYNYQIFEHIYGWVPTPRAGTGSPKFNPDEIGHNAYRSAKVVVHKACRRLESRGVVIIVEASCSHWVGIALTDAGRELTANLVVESTTELANKVM